MTYKYTSKHIVVSIGQLCERGGACRRHFTNSTGVSLPLVIRHIIIIMIIMMMMIMMMTMMMISIIICSRSSST